MSDTETVSSVASLVAAATEARKAGRGADAARLLSQAVAQHERTGEAIYRGAWFDLGALLFQFGRLADAERVTRSGLARRPKEFALVNLLGVIQKALGRYAEALATFDAAAAIEPQNLSPSINKGNIHITLRQGEEAVACFTRVTRQEPKNAEYQRLLGTAHRMIGEFDKAIARFEASLKLDPRMASTYRELAATLDEAGRSAEALALLQKAVGVIGPVRELMETQVILLRRMSRRDDAAKLLASLIAISPHESWQHLQMARTIAPVDRDKANESFAQALRLEPNNPKLVAEFAESLDRTRGSKEAENIAAAYDLAVRRLAMGGNLKPDAKTLRGILIRSGDYDRAAAIGGLDELGAYWASTGEIAGLHHQMGQVQTREQRRTLVEHHRLWGRRIEAVARQTPLARPAVRTERAKVRVGFMSSDLRDHPVAYFAFDLLTRYDKSRFEFYAYSWSTRPADGIQNAIASTVDGWRLKPLVSDRTAAQIIADDDLDILFELGGSTDMNKLDVMAWKPAPRQASWLGYPHSAGLETIDRILVDPFIKPDDPALLVEKPFLMPRTWVALRQPTFGRLPDIDPLTPQERTGRVTFGTMNNPYKYNARVIETWAAVLNAVPGSRFLFVRPEGGVASFRANIEARFEAHGVSRDRIGYVPVRGVHLPHYNEIDVALDTFPQTGGTTTCETLWMGVPTVTLVGEAFYERLSYSNLNNAGLGELCAFDRNAFVATAVETARRTEWRTELRRTMRERLRQHPLGNPDLFVADFQDTLLAWMDEPA
ncbi:O-linked N-acetylglucosamine transferase, SPINDLY family protein [Alsobacter sp. R-9]